jgi:membrane associated rhomboid family serine protease
MWLLIATVIVSLLVMLGEGLEFALGFVPARVGAELPQLGWAAPVWLTPLTATLVHGGILHLAFNMLMLAWCGLAVERVLGRGSLLTLYGVSAYAAMLAQYAVDPQGLVPVIGASGAVSGLIGAYALSFGRPRRLTSNPRTNRYLNIAWLAVAWTVLQVMVGWAAGQQGLMLATPAHIGGFVAGLLLQRPLLLWRYRRA